MRGVGRRFAALAVLGGLIPASALAQSDKPVCRSNFQYDSRTSISDVIRKTSRDNKYSLLRTVTLSPVSVKPANARDGRDANSPKLIFDVSFNYFPDFSEGITRAKSRAAGFHSNWDTVGGVVDGDTSTWRSDTIFGSDGDFGKKGETSNERSLLTFEAESKLVEQGRTLELRLANLKNINDIFERGTAQRQISRFTTIVSYDRQSQFAAFYNGQDRVNALYRRAQNGDCAPVVLRDDCFLTTASCAVIGLADDCWELRTLREFRDGWLAKQDRGAADIERYYREAPTIAQRLRVNPAAAVREYWRFILPSALAAAVGANKLARRMYTRGMNRLSAS